MHGIGSLQLTKLGPVTINSTYSCAPDVPCETSLIKIDCPKLNPALKSASSKKINCLKKDFMKHKNEKPQTSGQQKRNFLAFFHSVF